MTIPTQEKTQSVNSTSLFTRKNERAKAAPTIYQQTGWIRPHPQTICQEVSVLEQVTAFDYVLTDDFVKYFEARTGVRITECECGFQHVVDVLANPDVSLSETDHWRLTRAKLQDAWELYRDNPDPALVDRAIKARDASVNDRRQYKQRRATLWDV